MRDQVNPNDNAAALRWLEYSAVSYRLATHLLGSAEAVEDVVQQSYMDVLLKPHSKLPPHNTADERAWFLSIVAHKAQDFVRREARLKKREATVANLQSNIQTDPQPDAELIGELRLALRQLDEKYRLALALCIQEGLTHREAALVLDIPERTVSEHIKVGLERLKKMLSGREKGLEPSVLLSSLVCAAPEVPAAFTAAMKVTVIETAAKAALAGTVSAAATTTTATTTVATSSIPLGGLLVKISLGLTAAVLITAGLLNTRWSESAEKPGGEKPPQLTSKEDKAPVASAAKPTFEKFALSVNREYLDGPKMQAMCMDHRTGWPDASGNIFFRAVFTDGGALRVARADGMVETVVGDDRVCPDLGLAEGPASYFPIGGAGICILGAPLDGEAKGCIFSSIGRGLFKIYKNKDGRWWFKRQGKPDGATPPVEVGKSALISDLNTTGLGIQPDCANWNGNVYRVDLIKGELTCVLLLSDYETQVQEALTKAGQKWIGVRIGPGSPSLSDNGTIFIQYYQQIYPNGRVFRVSADRSKVEEVVRCTGGMPMKDGPGLETRWHCGPCGLYGSRSDSAFIIAIDSNTFRRWQDGRVSSLMLDGEWRECNGFPNRDGMVAKGMAMGPPGITPYVWIPYPGEERGGINGIFRFGPVDFLKPTVVPNAGGKK